MDLVHNYVDRMDCCPYSELATSYFDDILPFEITRIIFSFIDDIHTFGRAQRVNKIWYNEIQIAWRTFCEKKQLLEDESFWKDRASKNWKWISVSKLVIIDDFDYISKQPTFIGNYVKKDEQGAVIWSYEGEWALGQRQGFGTLRLPSGSTYKGEWKAGERDGSGYLVFVNPSSSYYDGQFRQGKRHGKGLCVWIAGQWKGDRYYGDWENDYMHGWGRYTFASGAYYEGQWKEDKMHGEGAYQYRSGNQYRGLWKEDKMHFYGSYHYSNGNCYMGEMHEDWKQGHGTFYYSEWGSRYEGQFVANKPSQKGIYYWKDGSRYEGEWTDGRRTGLGKLVTADGCVYEQEWHEVIKHPYTNAEPPKFPNQVPGVSHGVNHQLTGQLVQ